MPEPADLRSEYMMDVRCAGCHGFIRSKVPVGLQGKFFHPGCDSIAGMILRERQNAEAIIESSKDAAWPTPTDF